MDVGTALIANTQAAKLMQPGQCALHDPAKNTQVATMGRAAFGQDRSDVSASQRSPVGLRIVGPIALEDFGSTAWMTGLARNSRNRINER